MTNLQRATESDWAFIPELWANHGRFVPRLSPSEWSEANIHFGYCKSPPLDKFDLNLTPYMREPIDNFAIPGALQMDLCWPPQSGKTLVWMAGCLYEMANDPAPAIIVYSNDDMARDMSTDRMIPLLKSVKQFEHELKAPFALRKDCYQLAESNTWFTGSGSAASLASRSARRAVADETDKWMPLPKEANPLDLLRHRTKTYTKTKGLVVVCTPTVTTGVIWQEYLKGSMAEWYWPCLKCGHYQRPNTKYLQWNRDKSGDVIENSIKFICEKCKHEHSELDKPKMNLRGKWIHKYENRKKYHRSYHLTAIASPFVPWPEIARAKQEASIHANPEKQQDFDNAILAIPFSPRQHIKDGLISAIDKHKTDYSLFDIKPELRGMFMAVDTQDDGFYWIIRALTANADKHLIAYGFAETLQQLTREWNVEREGKMPMLGIIDQGGHRTKEVTAWVQKMKYWWKYRGESRISIRQRMSKEDALLILAKPHIYKSDLLYYIYTAIERGLPGYWYLPSDLSNEYCRQLVAYSPDRTKKNGNEFEQWVSHSKQDHFFDCEKMWLVIAEFAQQQLKDNEWWRPDESTPSKKLQKPKPRKPTVPLYLDDY